MKLLLSELTPTARRFLFGTLLNSLGGGLTLPIIVVYLHRIAGLPLSTASLVLSWMAIVGLASGPAFGWAVDKYGPRRVMLFAIAIEAAAIASWSLVRSTPAAFFVSFFVAIGAAGIWPPQTTMISRMASDELRQKLFGLNFMMLNLGLGIGGLFSSLIVDINDPSSFTRLFVLDGISYLVFLSIIYTLREHGGPIAEEHKKDNQGFQEVFRDKPFIKIQITKLLLLIGGYASLDAGLAPLLTEFGGLNIKNLGPVWAVNTGIIVLGQIFVINRLIGKSRTKLFAAVAVLWAASWSIVGYGVNIQRAFLGAVIGVAVFAIGEMIWSTVGPTLTNDLAPEHLRGRYNSLDGLIWVSASAIGPAISGFMLQNNLVYQWIGMMMIGLLISGYFGLRMRKYLTPEQDGILVSN